MAIGAAMLITTGAAVMVEAPAFAMQQDQTHYFTVPQAPN